MKLIKTTLQNGMEFWYREDDKFVGQRIALQKYEEYESELMLRQVNTNSVVIDVGANIGYYTLLLAGTCKKVYALEPDLECYEILKKNIKANKLKNVVLINKAASDKKEKLNFVHNDINLGDSRILTPQSCGQLPLTGEPKTIFTDYLDNVLKKEKRIDLIKIDTQGWEPAVVKGARRIIKKYRPIIFLEYSPASYQENNLDGKGMLNFLKQIYKRIWTIDYWFYFYKRGIKVDQKTGYVDLVMGIKSNIFDQYKNLQWKKVIKKLLKYN